MLSDILPLMRSYILRVSLSSLLLSYNSPLPLSHVFFFNDPATTEIYTLSLHDALPISRPPGSGGSTPCHRQPKPARPGDRKSTRLNSSHTVISYAVFCLKKKKKTKIRSQLKVNREVASKTYRVDTIMIGSATCMISSLN